MKILFRLASTFFLTLAILTFMACGGSDPKPIIEPEPTPVEEVTAMLTSDGGTWTPSAAGITVDDADVTAEMFDGFTITFGDGTLTTTGTTPVWLRNDTWAFTDETATALERGQDDKIITITNITENELTLTLQWDEYTYEEGRKKSIPGVYEFVLTK